VSPPAGIPTAREIYRTDNRPDDRLTDLAVWPRPEGGAWLLVAARSGHTVRVYDALTGQPQGKIGKKGEKLGRLQRPYGVAVADDFLFVADRQNQRIQVFGLPSHEALFEFGGDVIEKPYGLSVHREGDHYEVFVADNSDLPDDPEFARHVLGRRIKHFRVTLDREEPQAKLVRMFGEVENEGGILTDVQYVLADPAHDQLFISDQANKDVKVYDLEGRFTGRALAGELIERKAIGLAVIEDESAEAGGYLLIADAHKEYSRIHVFTRDGRRHLGRFTGDPIIARTEGIAVWPTETAPFGKAALFMLHDRSRVHAYSWAEVLEVLETGNQAEAQPEP